MVLDTIENNSFVFKNTYENDKQVRIPMDHEDAPDEFFFVHINYTPKTSSPLEDELSDSDSRSLMTTPPPMSPSPMSTPPSPRRKNKFRRFFCF